MKAALIIAVGAVLAISGLLYAISGDAARKLRSVGERKFFFIQNDGLPLLWWDPCIVPRHNMRLLVLSRDS